MKQNIKIFEREREKERCEIHIFNSDAPDFCIFDILHRRHVFIKVINICFNIHVDMMVMFRIFDLVLCLLLGFLLCIL